MERLPKMWSQEQKHSAPTMQCFPNAPPVSICETNMISCDKPDPAVQQPASLKDMKLQQK